MTEPNDQDPNIPRTVHCVLLHQDLEGLPRPPLKGELGERLYANVSKAAWQKWLEHSKMLINEFRLDLVSAHGQKIWMAECERFFFGEGSSLPPDFRPSEE